MTNASKSQSTQKKEKRKSTAEASSPPPIADLSAGKTGLANYGFWWKYVHDNLQPAPAEHFRRGCVWS
jgi:cyanobactin cluster PatC/TenC/TruC protein